MLRKAEISDLKRICEIEEASFSEPWSEAALRDAVLSDGAVRTVVSVGEGTDGFVIFSLVGGEAEIYDLAVDPKRRCSGTGGALVRYMLSLCESAFLEVRESNAAARRLYEKCGFTAVGLRKGYYQNGENAIVMTAEGEINRGSDTGN